MRILAIDPGAKRCGWAIFDSEGEAKYKASGLRGLERTGNYQDYRLALIDYWVPEAISLVQNQNIDVVVSEVVPPTGGNLASIINRQLAVTVVTTIQAMTLWGNSEIRQLGASTVKKAVGGTGKASKVQVRDGVLSMLPELEHRRKEWTGKTAVYDEVDALAIGLTYLLEKIGQH